MFEKKMLEVIEYIEANLTEEIYFESLEQKTSIPINDLKTLFSILFDVTLMQYIRNRRLSEAGKELLLTDQKIIDIAIKYHYSSATTFSRAFTKFHGTLPSKVKVNPKTLLYYPKIVFQFSEQNDATQCEIIDKKKISLVAMHKKINRQNIVEEIQLLKHTFFEQLNVYINDPNLSNYKLYQCCEKIKADVLDIYVGIEETKIKPFMKELPSKFSLYRIPEGSYLLFAYTLSSPTEIAPIWKNLIDQGMIANKFEYETIKLQQHNGNLVFEYKIYIPRAKE